MLVLMPVMTPALRAELRHAATIIRDAIAGDRPGDPAALTAAHRTLTQRRGDADDATRTAIDHYLDDDTWRHGPRPLHQAALALADRLGVTPLEPSTRRWFQPTLFDEP
jgi:hypothetical protein